MKQQGQITGFTGYNESLLSRMKADLCLTMPLDSLRFCQDYYRNTAKRDPLIAELKMLDQLSKELERRPDALLIDGLTTYDKEIAVTYRDLMKKRAEWYPDVRLPASLMEIGSFSNSVLRNIGISSPDESFRRDDFLLFCEALPDALPTFVRGVRHFAGSLLSALLGNGSGHLVDLNAFGTDDPFADMVKVRNGFLIAVERNRLDELKRALTDAGIPHVLVAGTSNDGKIRFLGGDEVPSFILSQTFLAKLFHYRRLKVSPDPAVFRNTAKELIAVALSRAADGFDSSAECFRAELRVPEEQTPEFVDRAVAAMLALYRVSAELCVPVSVETVPSEASGELVIRSEKQNLPERLTGLGDSVGLTTLPVTESGFPDFSGVRTLLSALADGKNRNRLFSFSLLRNAVPMERLSHMSHGDYYAYLSNPAILSDAPIDFGILVETAGDSPFKKVGSVLKKENPVK